MKRVLWLLMLIFVISAVSYAQVAGTANVQGTIQDATGAVVPGATVTITNVATSVTQTTKTDASGVYSFPSLKVGTYNLSVAASGFQTYQQTGIVLEVGSNIALDAKLTVGSASQTVQVEAQGLALQTEDTSFKQTIDQTDVTEMPLNGRRMTDLITLSGASTNAPGGDFTGSKYSYAAVSVSIAGGMGNTTEWKLDGGTNNDYMANANLPFPFPDAVNEFSVESTAQGASTGNHTGGLVNVVTRSGTNQFHGTGFEFIRNSVADASNFFSASKDQLHQNQYGGTIGGPIARNKLFFFTGFQRETITASQSNKSAYVPTAANLAGDFSVTDPAGNPNVCDTKGKVKLIDPMTGVDLSPFGNKYGQPGGPPVPTWSAAALKLQAYLPKIVPLPDGSEVCGHVFYSIPSNQFDKQSITRIDYNINSRNTLYGHYFLDGYQMPAPFSPDNILVTTQSGNIERTQSFTLGEDFVINQNVVNSAHLTLLRRVDNRGYSTADINAGTLGVNAYQLQQHGLQLTVSTSGKNHGFTIGGGTNSIAHFNDNTIAVSDNVNWTHGKHQFIFGGEWIHNQLNINNVYEGNGVFGFNGEFSGTGPSGGSTVADANLDFLLGSMSSFQQSKAQQNALRGNIPNLYFQDTFHASTRLTVVAGIRWTPAYLPVDYFNRGVDFSMAGFLNGTTSSVYPNAPPGISFYGDPGVTRQFTKNSPNLWSPNVGITFDPVGDGKTVFRAGFELAWDQPNWFTSQRNQQNPPYATASSPAPDSSAPMLCFDNPWLTGGSGNGCAQTGGNTDQNSYPSPQVPTKATAVFPAHSQYIMTAPNFEPMDTSMWTASIQHSFGRGWQVQAQYIGNRSSHDAIGDPIDLAVFIPGVWGAGGTGCQGFVTTGPDAVKPGKAGTNCSITGNYVSRHTLTLANPITGAQYLGGQGGSVIINDNAWSDYNGLVLSLNHRLSSQFSLLANYTWSKCLDVVDASGDVNSLPVQDPNNLRGDYGPCGQDYRNVENVSVVATSTVKRFDHVWNAVLSNWQVAPLIHVTTGSPVNVTAGTDISLIDVNHDRPNLVPGVPLYLPSHAFHNVSDQADEGYLNPAAFQTVAAAAGCTGVSANPTSTPPVPYCPALGTFGNLGRNSVHGMTQFQFDADISRKFPVTERVALTLRVEAFNVLNHPNFGSPSGGLTSNGVTTAPKFGLISSAGAARVFQGALKLTF